MASSYTIEQSYHFGSSPRKVFEALTTPRGLVGWFLSKADLDAEEGGRYAFDWLGGYHMEGRLKRFEKDRRVTFSWHDRLEGGETVETSAEFRVARRGEGTLLKLTHSGFHDPEHFAECASRWGYYLTNMKSVVDHGIDLRSKYDW